MSMKTVKNILLSNDDGIESRGIWALKEHLDEHFNVFMVVPDRERSASGHSISLHDPIRLKVVEKDRVFAVNGTPVDAVHLALHGVIREHIDVVVTGINQGLNLGTDVFYSGTISAASQAKALNIPAVAVSIDVSSKPVHYETASYIARRVIEKIDEKKVEDGIILSVNVPNLDIGKIEGVEVTRLGKRCYNDRLIEREDPKKNKYYWIEGAHTHDILDEGTDVKAVHERRVSITPLRFDITAGDYLDTLRQWNLDDLVAE
jgi:5'-nucleotidase